MKKDFWGIQEPGMVFMSNQDKELKQALSTVFPTGSEAHCCQHLADNIQKDFGLACRHLFWQVAKASIEDGFRIVIDKIKEHRSAAKQYLQKTPSHE